jgi:pimeloyl-ACP methyl ester carboxylesterase
MAAIFSLDPILSREVCQLMCATRPLMQKAMPYLMPRLPRAVAEDSVLHSWPSIRGAIHNILLARPIAKALMHIGSKTTLVHGSRDAVTPLERMRAVASASGASLVIVDADHHGYVRAMTNGFSLSRSAQSKNRFIANNTALT